MACEWNVDLRLFKIISDFELAILNTAKEFFTYSLGKGCGFHSGQIICRKVQKEGLSILYDNSEEFSIEVRMIKALAFLPASEVPEYYDALYKKPY